MLRIVILGRDELIGWERQRSLHPPVAIAAVVRGGARAGPDRRGRGARAGVAARGWRWLSRLLVAFALLLPGLLPGVHAQVPVGVGFVDALRYDANGHRLYAAGWAASEHANVFISNVVIAVDGQRVYRGRFQQLERPDVVQATGHRDWLLSGWQIEVTLPGGIGAGRHAVDVRFLLTSGEEFKLGAAPAAQAIDIPWRRMPSGRAVAVAAIAVLLPLLVFGSADRLAGWARGRAPAAAVFAASVAASFLLLVATGITGSSLQLALQGSPITRDDAIHWAGAPREIRSDEWRVLTPMAIGQFNHQPRFPVINRNVGIDGQNMLVIGMTGVPVAHISALAKPATWGFFAFDLRRALAWDWWFPFFGCFAALWLLLMRLARIDWRVAAVLAIGVSAAPYSIAYSGWPAYAVAFAAFAVVCAGAALRERRSLVAMLAGVLLGLSAAGFVLVLYPAWQVGLAYLLGPVALAAFLSDRRGLSFDGPQLAAVAIALIVSSALLFAWWSDARDAIAAIGATVYPGQRTSVVGGDIDPWFLIKGLMSPVTMYTNSNLMNQSDAGSFVYVLLPLTVAIVFGWTAARRIDAVSAVILAFVAVALTYMYVGFYPALAERSLWGRTISFRLDLALGLAQALLLARLIAAQRDLESGAGRWANRVAIVTAGATSLAAAATFRLLPAQLADMISPAIVVLSCAALGVVAYLLLTRRAVTAVAIHGAWMVATALPFNPIGQAPTELVMAPGLDRVATGDRQRIAIVGEHTWMVTAVAAGQPVVNTVMYYPQQSLWKRLDPAGEQRSVYNRYQHLLIEPGELPAAGHSFRIESQRPDAVRLTVDAQRFDFRLLGASGVLAPERFAAALGGNATLEREAGQDGWVLFRVAR